MSLLPVYLAFAAACLGLALQVRDWKAARERRIAECGHRWQYGSAWNGGVYWTRRCLDCPKQEAVAEKDVPEEWKR